MLLWGVREILDSTFPWEFQHKTALPGSFMLELEAIYKFVKMMYNIPMLKRVHPSVLFVGLLVVMMTASVGLTMGMGKLIDTIGPAQIAEYISSDVSPSPTSDTGASPTPDLIYESGDFGGVESTPEPTRSPARPGRPATCTAGPSRL